MATLADDASSADAQSDAAADDPLALHRESAEDLMSLVALPPLADGGTPTLKGFNYLLGPKPGHFNDGNRAIAHHAIGKQACLDGLKGLTLQTDAQKAQCKGAEYMVPIYDKGDPSSAKYCIDIFEFPNKPCELPMVWGSPLQAQLICAQQGKRLCSQQEWNLACAGDPAGKEKWTYAYGNELDMKICNTDKPHEFGPDGKQWACNVRAAITAWDTCSTNTEPSGAFPKCRSRFGVFDQHGNVAEEMTRMGEGGEVLTQLKGSAFFYVDVSRNHTEKQAKDAARETYPDHCAFDPRWHVEVLKESLHVNYHLGFRCCKPI